MIVFPKDASEAAAYVGRVRAGSTDLHERRRLGLADGDLVDLRDVEGLDQLGAYEGGLAIGAKVRIAELAAHLEGSPFGGLGAAAGGLATPEIRAVATVGGNLLQQTRCWYYRNPDLDCLRKGGTDCPARSGDHRYHACFGTGPCIAVHSSTLAVALLGLDARVEIEGADDRSIDVLLGRGWKPSEPEPLEPGAVLTRVVVPAIEPGHRAAYVRSTSRARAEWPLVEAFAALVVQADRITSARVCVGAVANVPLRLPAVESALRGQPARADVVEAAAARASEGATPLPMTEYKLPLVTATVADVLQRALVETPS